MKKMLKKSLALILALTMVLVVAPLSFAGGDGELFQEGLFSYSVNPYGIRNEDGSYSPDSMLEYCDKSATGKITIPATLGGYPVTYIGYSAFNRCDSITGFIVDKNNSYYSNDDLGILYNSDWTELIRFPIGTELTDFTLPDSVKSIGNNAFNNCIGLASVTIPDSVKSIGNNAFNNCTGLTSVTIPDSVTRIGIEAFAFCNSLSSIRIPDSVTNIASRAFGRCDHLSTISVAENNQYYSNDESGVLFNKNKTGLIQYPAGNARTSYTIPDSVTSISDYAFYYCNNLSSVTIGNGVRSIYYPNFRCCYSLTKITVAENNPYYSNDEYGVLYNKNKTGLIQYPAGNARTSYTIPDSVTLIGNNAFDNCTGLTSIIIPDSVMKIGSFAFDDCTGLTDVYYTGSEEDWNKITISSYNDSLINANIHFNYVTDSNVTEEPVADDEVVKNPSTSSISYGDSIVLHVDSSKIPAGGYVEWTASNGNFDMSVSADGTTCKVSPKSSGKTVFTATVYDKDGNIISSDTQEMTSKAGFFDKIVAFFKKIFGMIKTIPEAFNNII